MLNSYDVIIVGAGPAGLACAAGLSNSSMSVLLIEKNEIIGPKVCAGGLTTKIVSFGYKLNIADNLFSQVKINVPGKSFDVNMDEPFVATIDREKLAEKMLDNVSSNVDIVRGLSVGKVNENWIEIGGKKIGYRFLVGADGSNSLVRRYLGLKIEESILGVQYIVPEIYRDLELFFDARYFHNGYAWIFPHAKYTSIGCGGLIGKIESAKLKSNFEDWLIERNIDVKNGRFEARMINFDYRGYDFGNKFLVGDAAGFTSGMTGEGIYFAMVSGMEVAKKIIDPKYSCPEIDYILQIKNKHERILKFTGMTNSVLLNYFYQLFPFFFSLNWLKKRAIRLFC